MLHVLTTVHILFITESNDIIVCLFFQFLEGFVSFILKVESRFLSLLLII